MAEPCDYRYKVVQVAQSTLPGPAVPAVCPQACVSEDALNASASLYLSYSERESLPCIQWTTDNDTNIKLVCEEYKLRRIINRGEGDCFYLALQQCLQAIKHKDALDSVDTMRRKISDALMNAFIDQKAELCQRHDFLMRCSEDFPCNIDDISENAGSPGQRYSAVGQLLYFGEYCNRHRVSGTWATNEQVLAVPKVYGVCLRVFAKEQQARQGALQIFSPLTRGNKKDEKCQQISMFCNDLHYEALIPDDLYEGCDSRANKDHVFCHTPKRDAKKNHDCHPRKRERSATDDDDPSQSEVGSKQMLIEKLQAFIDETQVDKLLNEKDRESALAELHMMLWDLVNCA